MSHIVFISPYYVPEKAAAAVCVSENAKRLAQKGHQVTVLTTFPNYPTGIIFPEYRKKNFTQEIIDQVRVIRIWSYATANEGILLRLLSHLSFALLAPAFGAAKVGHPDCIIVQSPPLFDAIAVRLLAWWKKCPFIFMVSDLWPESAIQLGMLKNPILIALAEWLEWSTYQRAQLVWAVTEEMKTTLLQRGLAPEQVCLLTNGVDTVKFHPMDQQDARLALGWSDHFIVLYAGTHGLSHGLMTVLEAAELLLAHTNIHFVLMGDGAEKEQLVVQARQRNISNVTFIDPLPHDMVPIAIAASDVCLAHTRRIAIFRGMLPIKMYEAMACGKPLILALNGEAQRVAVKEAQAALHVEPEHAGALARSVLILYSQPELRRELGLHGRSYVLSHYAYDLLVDRLDEKIAQVVDAYQRKRRC
ncbi:MAG TPA: glycosyltransferase family 4 protein [Dictyobacter sp.]|jgi:glycosyltransferase involved in cell wall biosynthesis|nr:glycosyltransferase family 4 protein [Dictyobacter sp.]